MVSRMYICFVAWHRDVRDKHSCVSTATVIRYHRVPFYGHRPSRAPSKKLKSQRDALYDAIVRLDLNKSR